MNSIQCWLAYGYSNMMESRCGRAGTEIKRVGSSSTNEVAPAGLGRIMGCPGRRHKSVCDWKGEAQPFKEDFVQSPAGSAARVLLQRAVLA